MFLRALVSNLALRPAMQRFNELDLDRAAKEPGAETYKYLKRVCQTTVLAGESYQLSRSRCLTVVEWSLRAVSESGNVSVRPAHFPATRSKPSY